MVPYRHEPVFVDTVAEMLSAAATGTLVDATLGGGGHAAALLHKRPELHLVGIDRDPAALLAAGERLASFGDRVHLHRARFDELAEVVHAADVPPVTGVLFDLGVSSPQLDQAERGFSYRHDAPLDMRMDQGQARTAADIVNGTDERELAGILHTYGDERFARRIAAAVVAARPVRTTSELAELVRAAIPAATRRSGGHPAKRTFQAIRIEVNDELTVLGTALDQAVGVLEPAGRLVVISYHSGEDRIVKRTLRQAETGGCTCPPNLPCVCGAQHLVRPLGRRSRTPSAAEVGHNSRAASARLRAVEKLAPPTPPATAPLTGRTT